MATAVLVKLDSAAGHQSGMITLSCHVVFSGSDVYNYSDFTYVDVEVDPTGPAANIESAIVAAILAEAARFSYSLVAANIVMPTLKKGA